MLKKPICCIFKKKKILFIHFSLSFSPVSSRLSLFSIAALSYYVTEDFWCKNKSQNVQQTKKQTKQPQTKWCMSCDAVTNMKCRERWHLQ